MEWLQIYFAQLCCELSYFNNWHDRTYLVALCSYASLVGLRFAVFASKKIRDAWLKMNFSIVHSFLPTDMVQSCWFLWRCGRGVAFFIRETFKFEKRTSYLPKMILYWTGTILASYMITAHWSLNLYLLLVKPLFYLLILIIYWT